MISFKALTYLHQRMKLRKWADHLSWRLKQYEMTVGEAEQLIRRANGECAISFDLTLTHEAADILSPLLFVADQRQEYAELRSASTAMRRFELGPAPVFRVSARFDKWASAPDRLLQTLAPAIKDQCAKLLLNATSKMCAEAGKYRLAQ